MLTLGSTRGAGGRELFTSRMIGASLDTASTAAACAASMAAIDDSASARLAGSGSAGAAGMAAATGGSLGLTSVAGGSERGGMTGAMPSNVCFRKGFSVTSGVDVAVGCDGRGGTELALGRGGSEAGFAAAGGSERCCGITGAMPSSVCLRRGLLAATNGVAVAGAGAEGRAGGGSGAGG
jgi:hypothetical protein